MGMTHYMELMMGSWYLLVLFMALPMFLAECYVVSEILLLVRGAANCPRLKLFNKLSAYASAFVIAALSCLAGAYFLGVQEWRTWVDVTAAIAYVLAGVPFIAVALIEAGWIAKAKEGVKKAHYCVAAVVAYLILSHAAMVFGMFDPMQFGWQPEPGAGHHMMNHDMGDMSHGGHEGHMGHAMPMDHSMHHGAQTAPEGYHVMPDGTVMKNGGMTMAPHSSAPAAEGAGHCGH